MVTGLKVSFLWTRTFFQLFDNTVSENSQFRFFTRPSEYKEKIKFLYTDNSELTLPWQLTGHNNRTNWFWRYYLNDIDPVSAPHDTVANRCYPLYVPVRKSLTKAITVNWPESFSFQNTGSFEGFFYRHGIAFLCTFTLHGCPDIKDAVQQAMSLRHDAMFSIPTSGNAVSLTKVSDYCRNLQGEEVEIVTDWFDEEPFSLVTIVDGDSRQIVSQGDEMHRVLEAFTSWDLEWQTRAMPTLEDHAISIKNKHREDIMYGHDDSRVIWIPRLFVPDDNYALLWYCRNLLMASMQVKSFRDFLVRAEESHRINNTTRLGGYAREIGAILRRMEQGLKTYRTMSVSRQIKNDPQLQNVLSILT